MIEQEMVERAAKALEKLTDQKTYGWTDEEFEIWWNKDPNFVAKVHKWPDFEGTLKQRCLYEARTLLEAAEIERRILFTKPADRKDVLDMASWIAESDNTRGPWMWATFDDGAVILMCYPKGDNFEKLLQKGTFT